MMAHDLGDDVFHSDYPLPAKKYESVDVKKLQDRANQYEWALKVALQAMQRNIDTDNKLGKSSLYHAIDCCISALCIK